ncbi:MAG: OsmC family protein [Hyphomicrobiaceae bacterium]
MVTIKPKTTVKQRMTASCPTHSRSDVSVRDVSFVIDEPVERDGTNMGPTPTETALGALAGCTNVIGNKVAHKLGLDVSNFNVSIVADFDRRGVTLNEEIDVPFEAVKLRIELSTTATQAEIDQLAVEVAKYCPLAKLFRQAGTKIEEEWVIRAA